MPGLGLALKKVQRPREGPSWQLLRSVGCGAGAPWGPGGAGKAVGGDAGPVSWCWLMEVVRVRDPGGDSRAWFLLVSVCRVSSGADLTAHSLHDRATVRLRAARLPVG